MEKFRLKRKDTCINKFINTLCIIMHGTSYLHHDDDIKIHFNFSYIIIYVYLHTHSIA